MTFGGIGLAFIVADCSNTGEGPVRRGTRRTKDYFAKNGTRQERALGPRQ